jgi:hypothetical protein
MRKEEAMWTQLLDHMSSGTVSTMSQNGQKLVLLFQVERRAQTLLQQALVLQSDMWKAVVVQATSMRESLPCERVRTMCQSERAAMSMWQTA